MKLENINTAVIVKHVQTSLSLSDYEKVKIRALRDKSSMQDFISTAILSYVERREEEELKKELL